MAGKRLISPPPGLSLPDPHRPVRAGRGQTLAGGVERQAGDVAAGSGERLHQLAGGLKAAMGYVGARDLTDFRERATFVRISNAGLRESHAHDVTITRESPNYHGGA